MHHRTDRKTHTTAFVTPVVWQWLEQEIDQWVHHEAVVSLHAFGGYMMEQEGSREMFHLTTHSTHFIFSYMASDIW